MAGPHHALFSLALADVYHADFGYATDFAKIEGLPVSNVTACPMQVGSGARVCVMRGSFSSVDLCL